MKSGIRILGIDDAAFNFEESQTELIGVLYRGTEFIENIRIVEVSIDGDDATEKVLELYQSFSNLRQIKAVLIDGISFAGFNLVDIRKVSEELDIPVVAVTSSKPDPENFRRTMDKTGNKDKVFDSLGKPREVELEDGKVFVQYAGADFEEVEQLIRSSTLHGLTPEPIRVAHIMGKAL